MPDEAEAAIADLLEYLKPVPLLAEDYQKAIALMQIFKLVGGGIFDPVIAQAALKAEVDYLLTLNPKDRKLIKTERFVLRSATPPRRANQTYSLLNP